MGKDACQIKGNRNGLVITVSDGAEFLDVITFLKQKLSSAQDFFAGASVKLFFEGGEFSSDEVDAVERLIEQFGMTLDRKPPVMMSDQSAYAGGDREEDDSEDENTLLVRRTIRSGQQIYYDGNVVIMGDVNPGAEIVCSGDILVLGSLRGVAHAGVGGKVDASVFAFRLEPTQLRIAHYISRAPDEKLPQPMGPEIARVVENLIQISAYTH